MNTQNVNVQTATKERSERWGKTITRIIDKAQYNVACAEEASAHYGERFSRFDAYAYFIRGALSACFQKS